MNKFKPKWDGPHIVMHVKRGESDQPIALEILDLKDLSHRLVSFNNIKEAYLGNEVSAMPTSGELVTKYLLTNSDDDSTERVDVDFDPTEEFMQMMSD